MAESAHSFDFGIPHTFMSGSMFNDSTPRMANKPSDGANRENRWAAFDWVEQPKAIKPQGPPYWVCKSDF